MADSDLGFEAIVAMIRLGNGCGDEMAGLHTPQYDFNDDNLRFWTGLAEGYLADNFALPRA